MSGGVINPAYYELKEGETLQDAILLAGLSKNAKLNEILVERRLEDITGVFSVAYKDAASMEAKNADNILVDFIEIRNQPLKSVEIGGEVLNPGVYPITSDDTP